MLELCLELSPSSATADSRNQSAKLDFNEAIVLIKPNLYKLCSQEAARRTDTSLSAYWHARGAPKEP